MLDPVAIVDLMGFTSKLVKVFSKQAEVASQEKQNYLQKLEMASGDNVFKYIVMINVSSLESYVALTRVQAEQAFRWSKGVALIGFLVISVGIAVAIYYATGGKPVIDAAYLAALSGVFIEFIAGVFFFLYNKTLQQLNTFHDKLVASENIAMAFLANSQVADAAKRDELRGELSKAIASGLPR